MLSNTALKKASFYQFFVFGFIDEETRQLRHQTEDCLEKSTGFIHPELRDWIGQFRIKMRTKRSREGDTYTIPIHRSHQFLDHLKSHQPPYTSHTLPAICFSDFIKAIPTNHETLSGKNLSRFLLSFHEYSEKEGLQKAGHCVGICLDSHPEYIRLFDVALKTPALLIHRAIFATVLDAYIDVLHRLNCPSDPETAPPPKLVLGYFDT